MKTQGHMIPPKDQWFPSNQNKEMDICSFPGKQFKIIVLRKLNELLENKKMIQWNQEKKCMNKLRFNKKVEIFKKKQEYSE